MNLIKKLSGSFLVGLTVIGLALSTSAFSVYEKEQNKFAGEIYVNMSASGDYQKLPSAEDYTEFNCENTSAHSCSLVRTAVPGTVPENFDATEASQLEQAGLIEENSDKSGVYTNPL